MKLVKTNFLLNKSFIHMLDVQSEWISTAYLSCFTFWGCNKNLSQTQVYYI